MKRYSLATVLLLVSVWVLAGCGAPALAGRVAPDIVVSSATATPVAPISGGAVAALEGTLENIYAQVSPSVVNIRVVQKQTVESSAMPQLPNLPGFPTLPGLPFGQDQSGQPQEFYQSGLGSGFVWDKDGHIVTNNHVVDGADKIEVTFYDGATVPGEIIGTDPDSDLAVVKVDVPASQLHPVQVGDSTQAKVGELVAAIGNPFGLEGTMTVGFISALGRSLPAESEDAQSPNYTIPDVIQTDAPINPGNSGGVLVNDQGQMVGVTAAIESPVRASAGIGFVIPSAIVQKVVPELIRSGHYDHPRIGISGTTLTPDMAKAMSLKSDQRGALVVDVVPGSPADKAGLRGSDRQMTLDGVQVRVGGDIIVAVDGQPVKRFDDLPAYLARSTQVGQQIKLSVLRDGKEKTIELTLEARPKSEQPMAQKESNASAGAWLGIRGATVNSDTAQAMHLPEDQKGVLVEQVGQGSPADKAGLRGGYKPVILGQQQVLVGGDVIVAVDGETVNRMEDLQAVLQQARPGDQVALTLLRDGKQIELSVTLAERPTN